MRGGIFFLTHHVLRIAYPMIATVTLNPALDKSVYIDRLHPNDANRISKIEVDAGGKGINASRVLKELGSETIALGLLGGRTGRFIEHVLNTEGISTDFVRIERETRTNICVQETSGAPPTMLNEPGPPITEHEFDELFVKVRRAAHSWTMVIFGGSLPPGAPIDVYRRLVTVVREAGARAILDSDGEAMRLGIEAVPFMIKPNTDEVRRLVGVEVKSIDDALRAVKSLRELGVQLVVVSMGAEGAVAGSDEGAWRAVPPQVKPVSTIGSGDSMVAGIAHILSHGGFLEEALRWGTAAGAATAMTNGAEICNRGQVLDLLDEVRIERLV
ncbi:MAG TPA: 1-phosphofructokinase [Armatimonadota bacterium]|nr:1-phosphofructokinase [Armatimonadota bacterium]